MEDRYCGSGEKGESSAGWKAEKTAAWESQDYFQRVEDREQEKYLAEWCRKHEKKSGHKRRINVDFPGETYRN